MSKTGTKAALKGKTVTAGKAKVPPRDGPTTESACQVCFVDDDSAPSVRVECRGGHEFTVRAVLVREEVWDMWAMRHMTEQDWADVGLTIGLRKRIRSRLGPG